VKVLVVEDDPLLRELLFTYFNEQGYLARTESDGSHALERVREEVPDVVILDVNLPGKDGFTICRELRPTFSGVIIMLTRRSDKLDHVIGLELGADNYLAKPIEFRLLEAHLKACLRRLRGQPAHASVPGNELRYGQFRIDKGSRSAWVNDRELSLQTAEFELLWLLATRAGEVLSRDRIMSELRGIDHDGVDRSIDMRISRLRQALADNGDSPARIKTVRGQGYLFSVYDREDLPVMNKPLPTAEHQLQAATLP